ncbi:extracellular solute-binding protein [Candidatus Saccharibacteria bacterium]|nr:extracellular solute-binding protein [Candidatus Saccharibacteria bacterium]
MKKRLHRPRLRYYLLFIGLIVFMWVYYFFLSPPPPVANNRDYKGSVQYPTTPITLTYWRVYDSQNAFDAVVADYQKLHPNVTVQIQEVDAAIYDAKLTAAAKAGTLPDIFAIRNDWLVRYQANASPAPESVFTAKQFKSDFASLISGELVQGNKVWGVAYSLPTLGLFYNPSLFEQAGLKDPPSSWQELLDANTKLSQKQGPALYKSGVALGTPAINNSADVLSVLMMQNGAQMTNQPPTQATFGSVDSNNYNAGAKALAFYSSFSNPNKTSYSWSDALGGSVQAFANGKTAMIIDYPFQANMISATNPDLKFKTAPLPQLNSSNQLNYSQYVAELVSSNSKNPDIAWDFLGFASSYNELAKYLNASGRVSSRPDLAKSQYNDPILGPFARQVVSATDWYQGYNAAASDEALREAMATVQLGYDPAIALRLVEPKVTEQVQKK